MKMRLRSHFSLSTFNGLLSICVLVLAIYIIFSPLLPGISFWWHRNTHPTQTITKKAIPSGHTLVIPSIYLSENIHEGQDTYTELKKGVWRLPYTSTPDLGGNTVIAGHRFYYTSRAVFYNLDKVKKSDPIIIYWNHKEYDYTVSDINIVEPSNTTIEQPTRHPTLTLYTCTPLWTSRYRLVIQAHLTGVRS